MKKYTFTRSAIVEETYVIEAETEAEALDIVQDNPAQHIADAAFLDWYTDDFVLVCEDTI